MTYRRAAKAIQFGAITHRLIRDHVTEVATNLGVPQAAAHEIRERILDILEIGATRLGTECPECGHVCDDENPMAVINVPCCPTHGPHLGGRLVIAFPHPDDLTIPKE